MVADARIVPTDKMAIPDVDPVQPVQDLYATAVADRPDLAQTRINIENTKIGLRETEASCCLPWTSRPAFRTTLFPAP